MSTFDKDDYLKDLPDPDDPILRSAGMGGNAGAGEPGSDDGNDGADGASGRATGQEANMSKDTENDDSVNGNEDADGALKGQHASAAGADSAAAASAAADSSAAEAAGAQSEKTDDSGAEGSDGKNDQGDKDKQADEGDTLTPLGQAKKEAADYLEALQRERAEFVNFRNRAQKEQDIFRQHGIIDVLTALLPALDDIDRIKEHSDIDDSFAAVATKIDKAFAKFDVEKFGEKGEDFDPTKHEAILHKPDADATKETVDTVVEAGYRIGDRVIRAARVVVASPQS